ncbi:MAG: hypothetical protein RRY03_03690 [Oscillospiraceae bacterium]
MNFETMYNQICGLEENGGIIADEFTPFSECGRMSQEIYEARKRLGARLGTDEEDEDLMILVTNYEAMQQIVAQKVYEYAK